MQKEFSIKDAFSQGWKIVVKHRKYLFTLLGFFVFLVLFTNILHYIFAAINGPIVTFIGKKRKVTEQAVTFIIGFDWPTKLFALLKEIFQQNNFVQGKIGIMALDTLRVMGQSLIFIIATRTIFDLFNTGTTSDKRMLNIKKYIVPTFLAGLMLNLGHKSIEFILSYSNPSLSDLPMTNITSLQALYPFIPIILLYILITIAVFIPFSLYDLIIVDEACSGIESLKISYALTKGCRFKLILFDAMSMIVTIATLGLAYSVVLAARIHVYKQLKRSS